MGLAALVPIGLFCATALFVSLRLLLLAKRTRELPEFAIGAGVVLLALVGMPLAAAGRIPANFGTPLGNSFFACGISAACTGIGLLFVFTWSVFRKRSVIGTVALGLALAALAVIAVGITRAGGAGGSAAETLDRTRPWAVAVIATLMLCFAWTGGESLRCWRNLRRRQALGLADAVVTNRFLVWGLGGLAGVSLCAPNILFLLEGRSILVDPSALAIIAGTGVALSVTWYLTFLPPASYLRRLGVAH